MEAGYPADAQAAFKSELGRNACALTGLAAATSAVNQKADQQFTDAVTKIRRLEAEGFETEARKETQTLVATFPNRSIPANIRAVNQPIGWWRRFGGFAGPPVLVGLQIAAVLLIALVLARGLWTVVARAVGRGSYIIRDFTGVQSTEVAGVSGLLATELERLSETGAGYHVRRAPANDGEFTLPAAITNAYPEAKVAAALVSLLDRVLPRRMWEITGTVLPVDPSRGVGLTVAIARRDGRKEKEITLWEAEFAQVAPADTGPTAQANNASTAPAKIASTAPTNTPPAERLETLILAAAVWLGYELARRRRVKTLVTGRTEAAQTLGTAEWRSYADFAIGDRHQKNGETIDARRAYFRALDADDANLGALLNLAGLLLYRPEPNNAKSDDPDRRMSLAKWLLERMDEDLTLTKGMSPRTKTAMQWRHSYVQAAMRLLTAEPAEAAEEARVLYTGLPSPPTEAESDRRKQARKVWGKIARKPADNADLAREMRWPTFVLWKSAEMEANYKVAPANVDPLALADMDNEWWTANTLYNLACYYARAYAHTDEREHLRHACRCLYDGIDRAREPRLMLAMAKSDRMLDKVVEESSDELDNLVGEKKPDPTKASVDRGRGIGIEIREALKTIVRPTNAVDSELTPKGNASQPQLPQRAHG